MMEGESGVKKLAVFAGALGYSDFQHYGQFYLMVDGRRVDGCYGNIFAMLEDNPGMINAMIDWIKDEWLSDEQRDNLNEQIT